MKRSILFPIVAVALLAQAALAADDAAQGPKDIPLEEWRAMALGKTLTYRIGPDFFALEQYAPTGNRVDLQLNNGECLSGTWSHANNIYCFDWDDRDQACFRHVRSGDAVLIIQMDNGVETASTQLMTQISDAPLNCGLNLS